VRYFVLWLARETKNPLHFCYNNTGSKLKNNFNMTIQISEIAGSFIRTLLWALVRGDVDARLHTERFDIWFPTSDSERRSTQRCTFHKCITSLLLVTVHWCWWKLVTRVANQSQQVKLSFIIWHIHVKGKEWQFPGYGAPERVPLPYHCIWAYERRLSSSNIPIIM